MAKLLHYSVSEDSIFLHLEHMKGECYRLSPILAPYLLPAPYGVKPVLSASSEKITFKRFTAIKLAFRAVEVLITQGALAPKDCSDCLKQQIGLCLFHLPFLLQSMNLKRNVASEPGNVGEILMSKVLYLVLTPWFAYRNSGFSSADHHSFFSVQDDDGWVF